MSDPHSDQLSPAGEARRQAMLGDLVETMKQTHRARRRRRRMLAAGGCACLALLIIRLAWPGAPVPDDAPRIAENLPHRPTEVEPVPPPERKRFVTVIVETDPTVMERYHAHPPRLIARIDDGTLLQTLASINRPAGLIRFGDQIRLSAPVTDAELVSKQ